MSGLRKFLINRFSGKKPDKPNGPTPDDSSNSEGVLFGFNQNSIMVSVTPEQLCSCNLKSALCGFNLRYLFVQCLKKIAMAYPGSVAFEAWPDNNIH